MKNKTELKRYLAVTLATVIVILAGFIIINNYEYGIYTKRTNEVISSVIAEVAKKYPDVPERELMELLDDPGTGGKELFEKYGIDGDETAIPANDRDHATFVIAGSIYLVLSVAVIVFVFMIYDRHRNVEIGRITRCIEQINRGNYELGIDSVSEDELSILKHEIYKTTVMLKEAADNSDTDKKNLKTSLEDISHQLKTPLTGMLVMLDNLIDDPEMDAEIRAGFIRDIKRETVNINFLVQAILKLSKFDANTITFIREKNDLKDIIDDSVRNVSALCDLRNISVEVKGEGSAVIECDRKWQTEALTNILKNSIDHSHDGQTVTIGYSRNNVYSMITVTDHGEGISDEDIPHIFERFYKGKNSAPDSIGIGLALSKSIIEEDKGVVTVSSDEDGTVFRIKYFTV